MRLCNRFISGFIKRLGVIEEGCQLSRKSFTLWNMRNHFKLVYHDRLMRSSAKLVNHVRRLKQLIGSLVSNVKFLLAVVWVLYP